MKNTSTWIICHRNTLPIFSDASVENTKNMGKVHLIIKYKNWEHVCASVQVYVCVCMCVCVCVCDRSSCCYQIRNKYILNDIKILKKHTIHQFHLFDITCSRAPTHARTQTHAEKMESPCFVSITMQYISVSDKV